MDWLTHAWDVVVNLDLHLHEWSSAMGGWFYALMALVVFAETGLVVMPFLPGDSLLFGLGVLAAQPKSEIDPFLMGAILTCATLLGDNTNYWLGRTLGPRVFTSTTSRLLNRDHLMKAQRFYEKYGAKTIVLARFIAVVRTFAPFVAGIARMDYRRFLTYSVVGALLWVWGFILLGWALGNWAPVRDNFSVIVWAIMALTIVLGVTEAVKARRQKRAAAAAGPSKPVA